MPDWTDLESAEICYNVHHMERNGRQQGNPWSLRQTGVYHRWGGNDSPCCFILLQPPQNTCSGLSDILRSVNAEEADTVEAFANIHNAILFSVARTWPDYIQYLSLSLDELVGRIQFRTMCVDLRH